MIQARPNPIRWVINRLPKSQAQLEAELRHALKAVFWALLLAPVIIVPSYYLVVAILR